MIIKLSEAELKELKGIRNYFGKHDVTLFEHHAYAVLDDFIKRSVDDRILKRSEIIELLDGYSRFLSKNGYMDCDYCTEEPYAIDEFLKTIN